MTREDVHARCNEEGLAMMGGVFDVILDREQVTPDQVMEYIDRMGGVEMVYEGFVVRTIDSLSNEIQTSEP